MKKIAIVAAFAMLSGAAYAGTPSDIADLSASVKSPWAWEAAVVYNHALTDINKNIPSPSIDTYGIDLTGIYTISKNHKFTLRFGYAQGEDSDIELRNFTFMPGYRYETPVTDKLSAFAGAGIGLGVSMLDYPGYDDNHAISSGDDMMNVVYTLEAGVRYAITEALDVVGAVMFNGGSSPFSGASYSDASEEQYSIGVRLSAGSGY